MKRPNRAPPLPDSINQQVAIRALQIIARQLVPRAMLSSVAQMALDGCSLTEINEYIGLD